MRSSGLMTRLEQDLIDHKKDRTVAKAAIEAATAIRENEKAA